MGYSHKEIEDKRGAVPPKFRANPADAVTPTFDATAATRDADARRAEIAAATAKIRHEDEVDEIGWKIEDEARIKVEGETVILQGPATEAERRNATARAYSQANTTAQLDEKGAGWSGRIGVTGLSEQDRKVHARAEEKRKADRSRNELLMAALQAQIDDLGRQIAWHNREIDRLTNEITDLQKLSGLITSGEFDPNNPAHAALRDEAGITQAEIDDGTALEHIQEGIDDRRDEIQAHEEKRDEAQELKDDLSHIRDDIKSGRDVDYTAQELDDLIKQFRSTGQNFDRNNPTPEQTDELRYFIHKKMEGLSREVEHHERKILTLEDLAQYKGTALYQSKVDEFLTDSDPEIITKIANDPAADEILRNRAGVADLKRQIESLEQFKETPDYATYLKMAIEDVPAEVRASLRNEPDLSEELTAALYQPFSDTLDAQTETATAPQADNCEEVAEGSNIPPFTSRPGLG